MSTRMVGKEFRRASGARVLALVMVSSVLLVFVAALPFILWVAWISLTFAYGEESTEIGVLHLLLLIPRLTLLAFGAGFSFALNLQRSASMPTFGAQTRTGFYAGLLAAALLFGWIRWVAPAIAPQIVPSVLEATAAILLGAGVGALGAHLYRLTAGRSVAV